MVSAVAISAKSVRSRPDAKVAILEPAYARRFVQWLNREHKMAPKDTSVDDIRLVIDIENEDGTVWTYSADRFALKSDRTGKIWLIDDPFRARFAALLD